MHLAIIPARSGSTRIKDKNVVDFCGRPLIAYPLAAARESGLFDTIHVSTDSERYAGIVRDLGFDVDFLRDPDLARNKGSLMETLRFVVRRYAAMGQVYDEICMPYATAALIEPADLVQGYQLFKRHGCDKPVIAVGTFPAPIERAFKKDEDGVLRWVEPDNRFLHSQECVTAYFDAAAFIFFSCKRLFADREIPTEFFPYVLPCWKVSDINESEDLEMAEMLYLGRKAKKALRDH